MYYAPNTYFFLTNSYSSSFYPQYILFATHSHVKTISRPRVLYELDVLRNFAKFTGKCLYLQENT